MSDAATPLGPAIDGDIEAPDSARGVEAEARDAAAIRRAAGVFRLVADTGRLAILTAVAAEARAVGVLAAALGVTHPVASRHLRLLSFGRLVESRRDGQRNVYTVTAKGMTVLALARALAEED